MNRLTSLCSGGKGLQALEMAAALTVTPPVIRLNGFGFGVCCFYFRPSRLGLLRIEIFPPFPAREDAC